MKIQRSMKLKYTSPTMTILILFAVAAIAIYMTIGPNVGSVRDGQRGAGIAMQNMDEDISIRDKWAKSGGLITSDDLSGAVFSGLEPIYSNDAIATDAVDLARRALNAAYHHVDENIPGAQFQDSLTRWYFVDGLIVVELWNHGHDGVLRQGENSPVEKSTSAIEHPDDITIPRDYSVDEPVILSTSYPLTILFDQENLRLIAIRNIGHGAWQIFDA